ncbi:hypothetical protein B0H15DRAFT_11779 [Mycena belliarum]|uniref:F-box domain-containing protein n=1 Tax=Mycena belliarum TaxID=1033014 RepID=A0AAD6Y004_9AGAR|nr:hypothetical protein B0H15DRAFT_11779 [Mycena belliae]
MSRRSARLKDVSNEVTEDVVMGSDEEDFEYSIQEEEPDELEFVPQKKRRKVATMPNEQDQKFKKVRGRRGVLSSLKEFPLDVLFEIFGHLNPLDLLNLSRTTKEIRGILMTRSAAFVWKESRTHVPGLPNLPPDLSEPQYANLAFDSHCHKCFTSPVQTVIWSARTRMCKKCAEATFEGPDQVLYTTELDATLIELVHSYEVTQSRRNRWNRTRLYSTDHATKLREQCDEFVVGGILQRNDPKFLEWKQQKLVEAKQLNHVEVYATWTANRLGDRSHELEEARRLRREAIETRLSAVGWEDELPFHKFTLANHKLVRQPKELTDRIWKNIEVPLVEFLAGLKKERLRKERQKIIKDRRLRAVQAYNKFRENLGPDALLPPKVEVIGSEPFRTVIEDTSVYPEEKVTEESFAGAMLQVPQFSEDWKRRKDAELLQIMKKACPDCVAADLQLATTFFACNLSHTAEPFGYPRILVTAAATTLRYHNIYWDQAGDQDQPVKLCLAEDFWNANQVIRFNVHAHENAKSVVLACGLDPEVTTADEMDEINPLLECLHCAHGISGRLLMRWKQAVAHSCGDTKWKCSTREEELVVQELEKQNFNKHMEMYHWQGMLLCKSCDLPKMAYQALKLHMATVHSVDTISLNDCKFHIDTNISSLHPKPLRLAPPVIIVEEAGAKEAGVSVSV